MQQEHGVVASHALHPFWKTSDVMSPLTSSPKNESATAKSKRFLSSVCRIGEPTGHMVVEKLEVRKGTRRHPTWSGHGDVSPAGGDVTPGPRTAAEPLTSRNSKTKTITPLKLGPRTAGGGDIDSGNIAMTQRQAALRSVDHLYGQNVQSKTISFEVNWKDLRDSCIDLFTGDDDTVDINPVPIEGTNTLQWILRRNASGHGGYDNFLSFDVKIPEGHKEFANVNGKEIAMHVTIII
eukprot:Trichotokara_eunicae@DN678_c0_g1_i2.p1